MIEKHLLFELSQYTVFDFVPIEVAVNPAQLLMQIVIRLLQILRQTGRWEEWLALLPEVASCLFEDAIFQKLSRGQRIVLEFVTTEENVDVHSFLH